MTVSDEASGIAPGTPTIRRLLQLSIPTLIIGVVSALVLWAMDELSGLLQHGIWDALPAAVGVDPDSGWWIFGVLTLTGGVLGMTLAIARDGWIALFIAVAVTGGVIILPVLCIAILPIWLLVSRAPEMIVHPPRSPPRRQMRLNHDVATPQDPPFDDEDDSAALSWSGDDARGQVTARSRAAAAAASAEAAETVQSDAAAALAGTDAPRSPARAIAVGVFGGLYLALTIGWILSVLRIPSNSSDVFSEAMWQFGEFFAAIAAALWFGATIYLTRESRFIVRLGWLVLGLLVLIPWPVFLLAAPL